MTEYVESETLRGLMVKIEQRLDRRTAAGYVSGLALRSALQRREMKGIATYGVTLDAQESYDENFWARMARDELLDALMYIEKAMSCDDRNTSDSWWRQVFSDVADAVIGLIDCVDAEAIKAMAATTLRPDLFPPAELRKEPDARPS